METIIIAAVFILATVWFLQQKKEAEQQNCETQKNWIKSQYAQITSQGFIVTSRVDDAQNRFSLAIDDVHARWILLDAVRQSRRKYAFSDLIRYDLYQNITTKIQDESAATLTATQTYTVRKICHAMHLDLVVHDANMMHRSITFLDTYTPTHTSKYHQAYKTAQNIIALLDYIDANRNRSVPTDMPENSLDIALNKKDLAQSIVILLNYIKDNRDCSALISTQANTANIALTKEEPQSPAEQCEPQQITLWDLASPLTQREENNRIKESDSQADDNPHQ